jgi:hypothetical protein
VEICCHERPTPDTYQIRRRACVQLYYLNHSFFPHVITLYQWYFGRSAGYDA